MPPFLTNDRSPRRSRRATDPRSALRTAPLLDARRLPRPRPIAMRGIAKALEVSPATLCRVLGPRRWSTEAALTGSLTVIAT
jgi:hypothetical protein